MRNDLFDITIADLGEDVKTVMIVEWLKQTGEPVRAGEPLLEVMTDKTNIEIASPGSGVLAEVLHEKDEVVEPGTIIGRLSLQQQLCQGTKNL